MPAPCYRNVFSSRNLVAASLILALFLAACGGSIDEGAEAPPTRTFEHSARTTQIPIRHKRIVTTTDQNALLPLLELGVRPVGSAGVMQEDGSHLFRRTQSYDTSGIIYLGNTASRISSWLPRIGLT